MATKNKWYLDKVFRKTRDGGYKGLMAVGEIIGDDAQRKAPFETGELETSLRVEGSKKDLIVGIGFTKIVGGYDVATRQHEDLTYNHLPGKQAKYLHSPLFTLGPSLLPYTLAEELKKSLK
jgi:hypothetical protein